MPSPHSPSDQQPPNAKVLRGLLRAPSLSGFVSHLTREAKRQRMPLRPALISTLESLAVRGQSRQLPAGQSLDGEEQGLCLIFSGRVLVPRRGGLLPDNAQLLGPGSLFGLDAVARSPRGRAAMHAWLGQEAVARLLGPARVEAIRASTEQRPRGGSLQRLKQYAETVVRNLPRAAKTAEATELWCWSPREVDDCDAALHDYLLRVYQAELLHERLFSALAREPRFGNVLAADLFRLIERSALMGQTQLTLPRGEELDGIYVLLDGHCGIQTPDGNRIRVEAPACLGHKDFLLGQALGAETTLESSSGLMARIDGEAFRQLLREDAGFWRAIHRGSPELIRQSVRHASHYVLLVDAEEKLSGTLPLGSLVDRLAERLAVHLQEHVLLLRLTGEEDLSEETTFQSFEGQNGWVIRKAIFYTADMPGTHLLLPSPDSFAGTRLPRFMHSEQQGLVSGNVNVTLVDVSGLGASERRGVRHALARQKDPDEPLQLVFLATSPQGFPAHSALPAQVRLVPVAVLRQKPPSGIGTVLHEALRIPEKLPLKQRVITLGRTLRRVKPLLRAMRTHVHHVARVPPPPPPLPVGTVRLRVPWSDEGLDRVARAATHRRIGLALGGGGGFGFVHVAVIRRLLDIAEEDQGAAYQGSSHHAVPIDMVSGSSFGSIVGAFYCALGKAGLGMILERRRWLTPFVYAGFLTSVNSQLWLDGLLGPVKLEHLEVPLFPVVADADVAVEWEIQHGTVGYGVRASSSMPPTIAPTIEGNRRLLDGGIIANVPVNVLRAEGADLLVASNPISLVMPRERSFSRFPLVGALGRQIDPVRRVQDSVRLLQLLGRMAGEAQLGAGDVLVFRPEYNSAVLTSFSEGAETERLARESLELTRFIFEVRAQWRAMLNNPVSLVQANPTTGTVELREVVLFAGNAPVPEFQNVGLAELVGFLREHEEIEAFKLVVTSSRQYEAQAWARSLMQYLHRAFKPLRELSIEPSGRGPEGKAHAPGTCEVRLEEVRELEDLSSREKRLLLQRTLEEAQARRLETSAEQKAQAGEIEQARTFALQAAQAEQSPAILRLLGKVLPLRGAVTVSLSADVAATALAWHPLKRLVAVGYKDGELRLLSLDPKQKWSVSHSQRAHPEGTDSHINALAWSADGAWLASSGNDNNLILWNLTPAGELRDMHTSQTGTWRRRELAFSPDGRYLLGPWCPPGAPRDFRGIGVYRVEPGGTLGPPGPREVLGELRDVAWRPAGATPCFATVDGEQVSVHALTEAGVKVLWAEEWKGAETLDWRDERTLAVGGVNGACIFVFKDAEGGAGLGGLELDRKMPLRVGGKSAHQVAWTPVGFLLTVMEESSVYVWNASGQLQLAFHGRAPGSFKRIYLHPNKPLLLSKGNEEAYVWDLLQGGLLTVLGGHTGKLEQIGWSADGEHLATAGVDGKVQVWTQLGEDPELSSWSELRAIPATAKAQRLKWPRELAWPSEGFEIPVDRRGTQPLWARVLMKDGQARGVAVPAQGQGLLRWEPQAEELPGGMPNWFKEHTLQWRPDGGMVAMRQARRVSLWDAERLQLVDEHLLQHGDSHGSTRLSWHPTRNCLAISQYLAWADQAVLIWDLETKSPPVPLRGAGQPDGVWDLAWAPGGTHLAVAYNNKSVLLFRDLEKGVPWKAQPPLAFPMQFPAKRVAWHPGGLLLASGDESGAVAIWDLEQEEDLAVGKQLRRDRLQHLVWSPLGTYLLAADKQGHTFLWKAQRDNRWAIEITLDRQPKPLRWAAFSQDEKWVLLMDASGRLRVHPIDFATLVACVKARQGQKLNLKAASSVEQ